MQPERGGLCCQREGRWRGFFISSKAPEVREGKESSGHLRDGNDGKIH